LNNLNHSLKNKNQLLKMLDDQTFHSLSSSLEIVSLPYRKVLYQLNEKINYVYFPIRGMISLVTIMNDGSVIETGLIGKEGMLGIPVLLDSRLSPNQALVQIPGKAFRLDVDRLKTEFDRNPTLRQLLHHYIQARLMQMTQVAACNRLHTLDKRFARWLLSVRDCSEGDTFPLTQEFIAQMLGVRRSGVSVVAGLYQQAGMIHYTRGMITLEDSKAMKDASCECYQLIKDGFERSLSFES
jgi:CRP-like cAMP-binding protein